MKQHLEEVLSKIKCFLPLLIACWSSLFAWLLVMPLPSMASTLAPNTSITQPNQPLIKIDTITTTSKSFVQVSVSIDTNNHDLSVLDFVIDYDELRLDFDPSSPLSITSFISGDYDFIVSHNVSNTDGEISVSIVDANLPFQPLSDGNLLSIGFTTKPSPPAAPQSAHISFSPTAHLTCGHAGQSKTCDKLNGQVWVINSPPQIDHIIITPTIPLPNSPMTVEYSYNDADENDISQETTITWIRKWQGTVQLQPKFNNIESISNTSSISEEIWCVIVTPHDGYQFGAPAEKCQFIEINPLPNTTPFNVMLAPSQPTVNDDLSLTYDFTGTQSIDETLVSWYRNDVFQPTLKNNFTIPSTETYVYEEWCAKLRLRLSNNMVTPPVISNCVLISEPETIVPTVSNITLSPSTPQSNQSLLLNYHFEGGTEDGSEIRWYRNGVEVPRFYNRKMIPSAYTRVGDDWYASIKPRNEFTFGLAKNSNATLIVSPDVNTAPHVDNLRILPHKPGTNSNLHLAYTFIDPEGNEENNTVIWWFKNNVRQYEHDNKTAIPSENVRLNDTWHAIVFPHDGDLYGLGKYTASVTVRRQGNGNNPPLALNVIIAPGQPSSDQDLVLSYAFFDQDYDEEDATTIIWKKNDEEQPLHKDRSVISYVNTHLGDEWCAIVEPHDGFDSGIPEQTCVVISEFVQNSPPAITNAYIEPNGRLTTSSGLSLNYLYADPDFDPQQQTRITWFKNNAPKNEFANLPYVPSNQISAGEIWYAEIIPHDGLDFGTPFMTPRVTINTPPKIVTATINPVDPKYSQQLYISFDFYDADGDTLLRPYKIEWYRNGQHVPELNGWEYVNKRFVFAGDQWHASMIPYDGIENGEPFMTSSISVGFSPPPPISVFIPLILLPKDFILQDEIYEGVNNNWRTAVQEPGLRLQNGIPMYGLPNDEKDFYYVLIDQTRYGVQFILDQYEASRGSLAIYAPIYSNTGETEYQLFAAQDALEQGIHTLTVTGLGKADSVSQSRMDVGLYLVLVYTEVGLNSNTKYSLLYQHQ